MNDTPPEDPHDKSVRSLLEGSYKEVLDATKHQDDKIGRLFTGVSFLTAAALAIANLGGSRYLSQRYTDFPFPPGVASLALYVVLVIMCVMLLINSLATPLRVPGLARNRPDSHIDYVGDPPLRTSQIYFAEIARVGLSEWEGKWRASYDNLDKELTQSLVKETHNLAVRTQYKYNRTTEAIVIFNLALLFMTLTVIYCLTAAVVASDQPVQLPSWSRWLLGTMFGLFFFIQLQGQIRYARQTVDELYGNENMIGAGLKYIWALATSAWIVLLASGEGNSGEAAILLNFLLGGGVLALAAGTAAYARSRKKLQRETPILAWVGTAIAVITGILLTVVSRMVSSYTVSFLCAVVAACILTAYSVVLPSIGMFRNRREFARRTNAS